MRQEHSKLGPKCLVLYLSFLCRYLNISILKFVLSNLTNYVEEIVFPRRQFSLGYELFERSAALNFNREFVIHFGPPFH